MYIFLLFGPKNGEGSRRVGRGHGASPLVTGSAGRVKMLSLRLLCPECSEFSGARQTNPGPDRTAEVRNTHWSMHFSTVHTLAVWLLDGVCWTVRGDWLVGVTVGLDLLFSLTTTASPTTTHWEFSVNPFCGKSRFLPRPIFV